MRESAQNISGEYEFFIKFYKRFTLYRPPPKRAIMSKQTAFLLPPAPDDRIYIAEFYFVPADARAWVI